MAKSRFKPYLIITLVLSGLLPIIGSTFLHFFLLDRYWIDEPLHSVVEALGSFTALSLALLILILKKNTGVLSYYLWVSYALIGMGLLDVFHAFSLPGDSFVWLHGMAILIGGFLFAMVWPANRIAQSRLAGTLPALVAVVAIIFGVLTAAFPDILPSMINEGVFTTTANAINILSGLLFLFAAVYFVSRYRSDRSIDDFLFANFCLLNGWAGLLFPLSQLWDADWWFWHLLRLIAYFTVISYMFITFQRSEAELKQHRQHLEELVQKRTVELKTTNEQLQQEIAERIRAEGKLHTVIARLGEEKSKTEAIIAAIGDSIIIQDTDYKIIYQNQVQNDSYGSHIGEYCYKAYQGRDTICEGCPVELSFRDGKIHRAERNMDTDRGILYFELTASPLKDSTGEIIAGIKVVRDITESKRVGEEKNRLLRAIASSTEGIAITDEEDRYIYLNAAHAMIYRYPQEELIGKTWREITQPDMIAPTENFLYNTLHNKEIGAFNAEFPGLRKDGTTIPTEVRGKALWDETGNYQGHICIVRDITERKLAEEKLCMAHDEMEIRVQERTSELAKANEALLESEAALRESEESYRKLVESSPDTIIIHSEGKIVFTNPAGAKLLGASDPEQIIGKDIMDFVHPDYRETVKEQIHQMKEDRKPLIEEKFVRLDGSVIDVEVAATPFIHQGKHGMQVIVRDITEKKKLEAQFLRAQRMESIGTLSSGIAHDINNVLTPMMLSLELLREKFTDNQSQKLINVLEQSTHRGASLVKQVQSFARGVQGERATLQVSQLISEITQITKETFPRSIEIRTDIQKDLLSISGDVTQLHQVLMNLCVNARDAMPDGGILRISAENIFIDENYARMNIDAKVGQYVVITVSDTGTGVPSEILDRIFEPFFTTKQPGKGTGLGLSTALAIVKSHGGFINVYSEVGKGTVFRIYLPVVKTTEAQKVDEQQLEIAGHEESILVVDDEAMVREITSSILESHGYRVLTANNGAEAIKVYTQNIEEIKVVLMDMMMPVMDGQACIRALSKINPHIKIIAVSGLAEKEKLAKVAVTHVKAFLQKPYAAKRLLKTIDDIINAK